VPAPDKVELDGDLEPGNQNHLWRKSACDPAGVETDLRTA
jgi:hypothetical protein